MEELKSHIILRKEKEKPFRGIFNDSISSAKQTEAEKQMCLYQTKKLEHCKIDNELNKKTCTDWEKYLLILVHQIKDIYPTYMYK